MILRKSNNQNVLQEILDELKLPAKTIEKSHRIRLCQQALGMILKDEKPELWAALQEELACNLLETSTGSHDENIELAIHHFKQVLEVRICQYHPNEWAMTQNNLGIAYRDRIRGDPDENIELAILHYNQALKVRTRESDPMRWAMTQHNLAAAYFKRVRKDQAENQEQAIKLLEEILESNIYQGYPKELASIQHDLSTVYIERIHGGRAENIERAIRLCQQALEVYTQVNFSKNWASLQYNLGNAYRLRVRGDRIENIEQAISYHEQALKIRTRQTYPNEWAQTQNILGLGYLARMHCKQEENIEQAIHHFQEALKVHLRDIYPKEWAQLQNNLGNAYLARVRGKPEENIKNAIFNYKQALEVRTREAYPEDWAETQNNLADLERSRASQEDIERALQRLLQVLDVYTIKSFPQYWARTHNNLAIMYSDRKQGIREENIKKAIYHYKQALKVYTTQAFPDRCLYSARALGNLAFDERCWELAKQSYNTAFEAQDTLMYASFSPSSEKAELAETQNLSPRAAYAHYKTGDIKRAVEILEKGRAQLLRESFELQQQNLERLRISEFQHLYDNYIHARNEYRSLQGAEISGDWKKSLKKLQSAAAAIREEAGQSHPEYRYFLRSLSFEEIQEQAKDKPLVYLIATHAGGLALVVNGQEPQAIELPELEQESLQKHIWRPTNEEVERINDHLKLGFIEPEDVQAVSGGYFSMYALRRLLENISLELNERLLDAWEETLDKTTRWLWDVAMGKLIPVLKEYGNAVTLISAGQLALLPLHAAWTEVKDRGKRLYALDELNISYAPSAHALWQASLAAERPTESILIVDNPDGSLRFSKDEVIAASRVFNDVTHLFGVKATVGAVRTEMQKSHVLLFSTHGQAGWDQAEQARLELADDHSLTLPDIFTLDLNQARLAILSACETGIPGLELIDEMIGLPAGLMQAGIPGVVGSLWPVNEGSTAVLMSGFYKFWRKEGKTPQEALREAQKWLRDSLFESPYYWAAFTYTGV